MTTVIKRVFVTDVDTVVGRAVAESFSKLKQTVESAAKTIQDEASDEEKEVKKPEIITVQYEVYGTSSSAVEIPCVHQIIRVRRTAAYSDG